MIGRVLVAAVLAASLLSAQRGGRNSGASGDETPMPRPRAQNRMDQIADKLKLNKEQKEEVLNIVNASVESASPISEQIANGRMMITQAMVQGQDNTDDFKKLMTAFTNALAQMDNLEATTFGKIYALLKPNQQKNAEQVFTDLMAGMFMRAGGGRGGRSGQ